MIANLDLEGSARTCKIDPPTWSTKHKLDIDFYPFEIMVRLP